MDTQPLSYQHLGWKTYWIFVSERARVAIAIGLIAVILTLLPRSALMTQIIGWVLLAFAVALVVTLLVSAIEYNRWQYLLSDDALHIRRGILRHEEVAIPYRQIQNADIERTILNQLTGTASLVILTAGHTDQGETDKADSEGLIPIIDHTLALNLQRELSSRANIQKVVPAEVK